MQRSIRGRASTGRGPGRRMLVAAATLVVFGGLISVSQVSNAETERAAAPCESAPPSASAGPSASTRPAREDGSPAPTSAGTTPVQECEEGGESQGPPRATSGGTPSGGGLAVLGNNCDKSRLEAHTGFQEGNRCVSTAFGEMNSAERNPALLITQAPRTVKAGQTFRLQVSTRNLVRDRFLPAGQGGYYLESSLLSESGLIRGHIHTACRMLTSTKEAAEPAPVPAFFVATEDGRGGEEPDLVTIQVPGLPAGTAQCAVWAGDGSHRIPMMQRANQTPAIDAVRIQVEPAEQEPPVEQPGQEPPVEQPGQEPPVEQPGGQESPVEQPGGQESPAQEEPGSGRPGGGASTSVPPAADGSKPNKPASAPTTPVEPAPDQTTARADDLPAVGNVADDADDNRLAFTGSNVLAIGVAGALLLVAGMVILYLTRRRRYRTARR